MKVDLPLVNTDLGSHNKPADEFQIKSFTHGFPECYSFLTKINSLIRYEEEQWKHEG